MHEDHDFPRLGPRFDDALVFAARVHAADVRKGGDIPYVAHLLGVCALVLLDGGDEDQAVAALLHDTLEDHPDLAPAEVIADRFGHAVLEIVRACTDTPEDYAGGPKTDWHLRKKRYIEHIGHGTPKALRVSLADKVDNARAILSDFRRLEDEDDKTVEKELWERFKTGRDGQLWYYRRLLERFEATGFDRFLMDEFRRTVTELRARVDAREARAADERRRPEQQGRPV